MQSRETNETHQPDYASTQMVHLVVKWPPPQETLKGTNAFEVSLLYKVLRWG